MGRGGWRGEADYIFCREWEDYRGWVIEGNYRKGVEILNNWFSKVRGWGGI